MPGALLGDVLLVQVARRLTDWSLPATPWHAWGDEFVLLLNNLAPGMEAARERCAAHGRDHTHGAGGALCH